MTETKIEKMLYRIAITKKSSEDLKENPYFDSDFLFTRWKVAAWHTIAKGSEYKEFIHYYPHFKLTTKECIRYPHWKIKILAAPILILARGVI